MATWIAQQSPRPWRLQLRTAMFRQAAFHVEVMGQSSGRRIAMHEYPKRDDPYAEDMGRRAKTYDVTGYLIENDPRLGLDYRRARNDLILACEAEGPGLLILPTLPELQVACLTYQVTENRERGGYCIFAMRFVEYGKPGNQITFTNTQGNAAAATAALNVQAGTQFADTLARWNLTTPQTPTGTFP